ncbi:MAG: hypothetical protein ACFFFG_14885 [Candidatus Thorarchaeota archaeon]
MRGTFLRLLSFLGETGYYARTPNEKEILSELTETGVVQLKKRTKNVYTLTREGYQLVSERSANTPQVSDDQFLQWLRKAYQQLANPLNPLVKIPDLRTRLSTKCHDAVFEKKMLDFHDQGVLTLHTAFSKQHAEGGIESRTKPGVYYYVMFEA